MKSLRRFRIFLKHLCWYGLAAIAFGCKATNDPNALENAKPPAWQDYPQTE